CVTYYGRRFPMRNPMTLQLHAAQGVLSLVVIATTLLAQPQQSQATYTATEVAKHIGENATVTDRVDSVHQSGKGNIFLNMGGKYPNQAFTAFIPAKSAG